MESDMIESEPTRASEPISTINLRVIAMEPTATRVLALTLESADGVPLPSWRPGAHIDVHLPDGLLRQYSLCSDPDDPLRWRIAVLYEPDGRGGSVAVHQRIRIGDTLTAFGPRDNFGYRAEASDLLFVAGGIGITPLLPMIHGADRAGRNWRLLYLGRSLESMSFRDELAVFGARVTLHASDTMGSLALSDALDTLHSTVLVDPLIYACGPERMLDALHSWCEPATAEGEAGAAGDSIGPGRGDRLHIERFTGTGSGAQEGDTGFIVETGDGTEIEVGARESILAALMRCGIPALNSCQEGICGTCETVVIEGTPDHRDQLLSAEEHASNETMMICVSRCLGKRLVLEL